MMPAINYGHGGANLLGDMPVHPGTYGIRQSTLRSLVADVGGQLAQNGFKWIFVLNGHGAPTHSIAIDEACDFVSETFGVTMLHLTSLFRGDEAIQARGHSINARFFSEAELSSFGMDVHAGVSETSGILAVRPDLVRSNYKTLPNQAGRSIEELRKIATAPGWQGYLSSPAKATAAHGRAVEEWWIAGFTDLILRAVRGEKMSAARRVPDMVPAPVAPTLEKELANEAAFAAKLEAWLASAKSVCVRGIGRAASQEQEISELRKYSISPGLFHPLWPRKRLSLSKRHISRPRQITSAPERRPASPRRIHRRRWRTSTYRAAIRGLESRAAVPVD